MKATVQASKRYSISSKIDVDIAVVQTSKLDLLDCFPVPERALLATVVSELARNITKYANRGSVRITRMDEPDRTVIEILAEDHGPGIRDIESAMKDHVSTGGTLGLGLPGVRRMMDEFEIESEPGRGTRVTTRKATKKKK